MRREVLFLREMLDAAVRIRDLTTDDGDPSATTVRAEALLWNYTVLGEAAAHLPTEFTTDLPDIEWSKPVRMRNRIVHGYWSIDEDVLRDTAAVDIPQLIKQLERILTALVSDEDSP